MARIQFDTTIEQISPEVAAQYLTKAAPNRRLNPRRVAMLQRMIAAGQWRLTHQGIAFDPEDTLLDGQHRLTAIAAGQRMVPMNVSRGVPADAIHAIDTDLLPRTVSDVRTIEGTDPARRGTRYLSIVRRLAALDAGIPGMRASVGEVDAAEDNHREDLDAVLAFDGMLSRFAGPVLAMFVWMRPIKPAAVDAFLRQLTAGRTGITAGTFLRWYAANAMLRSGGQGTIMKMMKVTAGAVRAVIEGRDLGLCKASQTAMEWAREELSS